MHVSSLVGTLSELLTASLLFWDPGLGLKSKRVLREKKEEDHMRDLDPGIQALSLCFDIGREGEGEWRQKEMETAHSLHSLAS